LNVELTQNSFGRKWVKGRRNLIDKRLGRLCETEMKKRLPKTALGCFGYWLVKIKGNGLLKAREKPF